MQLFSTLLALAIPLFSALHAFALPDCYEVHPASATSSSVFDRDDNYENGSGRFVSTTYTSPATNDSTFVTFTLHGTTITKSSLGYTDLLISYVESRSNKSKYFKVEIGESCLIPGSDNWTSVEAAGYYNPPE